MHSLTAGDLRRSRLHLLWVKVLLTVVLVALMGWDIAHTTIGPPDLPDRAPLGSASYLATSLEMAVLVLLATLWVAPGLTLLWLVPLAWFVPLSGVELQPFWQALSVVCLAALVWMTLRSHRARPDGPSRPPMDNVTVVEAAALRRAWPGWFVLAGGLVLTAGLLMAHQDLLVETRDFEARATQELAEIVSYDDDTSDVKLRIASTEYTVGDPLWDEYPDVGELVPVLVDPMDPEHIVFVGSLEDPSWLLGLAVVAPIPGLKWGVPVILRARRRRALVDDGAPQMKVILIPAESGYRILPVDGVSPILEVVNLAGLVPRDEDMVDELEFDGDETEEFHEFDPDDEDEEPLPESDSELAAWADEVTREMGGWENEFVNHDFSHLDPEEKEAMEAEFGPHIRDSESFVMLGSWSHGSSVALLRDSGQVWLAEIKEPRFQGGPRPSILRRITKEVGSPRNVDGALLERLGVSFGGWSELNVRWLRWAVGLGTATVGAAWVGAVVRFSLSTGWDWFDWVMSVVLILGLLPWPVIAAGSLPATDVARARSGIVFYGFVVDDVIAPDRLVTVVPGEETVALRLRNPEDAVFLVPEQIGADLNASQAAEQVRSWFLSAPTAARSGPRPSAGLTGALVMVAAWAFQILPLLS